MWNERNFCGFIIPQYPLLNAHEIIAAQKGCAVPFYAFLLFYLTFLCFVPDTKHNWSAHDVITVTLDFRAFQFECKDTLYCFRN
jgi:hypothetical protein